MATGILCYGAHVPRLRLQRQAAAEANAWFSPSLKSLGKGERSMAGWDEDPITMAVEAARDCLADLPRETIATVHLASTTLPFADRSNSAVVAAALNLPSSIRTQDLTGSRRAATSGLIAALEAPAGRGPTLFAAAEKRRTRAGSPQELQYGDGAVALLVGEGQPIAKVIATHSEAVDFVDQFRAFDRAFDYGWEERWIRDEGYLKIVPPAVAAALGKAGIAADAITHFCMPGIVARIAQQVAQKCRLPETAVRDNLAGVCGDTGAAHALVMLAHTLESAEPGERILVVGFGQGCDVLVLEVTEAITSLQPRRGVTGSLARRRAETSYAKFLAFNDLIPLERGMRAELDKATAMTALYRNNDMVHGLVGGRCTACGTLQFPKSKICVGPNCGAFHTQVDHPFAEMVGEVMSYTADMLTYSPEPPQHFGMIQFRDGGRIMMDFTDVELGKVAVGMPMRMVFRVKDQDPQRGFTRYFWKAAPVAAAES